MTGPLWPQRNAATVRTVTSQEGCKGSKYPNVSLFPSLRSPASACPWLKPTKVRKHRTLGYILCRAQPPGTQNRAKDRRES